MICSNCQGEKHGARCPHCGVESGMPATRPPAQRGRRRGHAPYQSGSATSRAGAVAVADKAATQRDRLAEFVRESNRDWTRSELKKALGWEINVITGRVNDLIHDYYKKGQLVRRRELVVIGTRTCRETGYLVEALVYLPYEKWREGFLL